MIIGKNCDKCSIIVHKINANINTDKYHILCKKCISEADICSKIKSKKLFMLSDNDIKDLKLIYVNGNNTFFLFDDIKKIIDKKYGSYDNFKQIIDNKKKSLMAKINKSNEEKLQREIKLKELLLLNKLEFKNFGDCYSYINYGKPSLDDVINNELVKQSNKNMRRIKLSNELNKLNIQINENIKSCYDFINNLDGDCDLGNIINDIKKDIKKDKEYTGNNSLKLSFD